MDVKVGEWWRFTCVVWAGLSDNVCKCIACLGVHHLIVYTNIDTPRMHVHACMDTYTHTIHI